MMTLEERKEEEALHSGCLRVPRRPPWNAGMSVEELDDNERQAFLTWRRSLARLALLSRVIFNLVFCCVYAELCIWFQVGGK